MNTLRLARYLAWTMIVLGVTACASRHDVDSPAGSVRMAPDLVVSLPQPSALGRSLEVSQLVTAHYGARTFVFEGHISANPERFLLVGLDPLGQRVLTVTWTEHKLTAKLAPGLPEQIHPENMLADIVVLYWPEASVRQALVGSNGTLVVGPHFRSIAVAGKEVIRVDYKGRDPWDGAVVYRNLAWGYELDVQSVELNP